MRVSSLQLRRWHARICSRFTEEAARAFGQSTENAGLVPFHCVPVEL